MDARKLLERNCSSVSDGDGDGDGDDDIARRLPLCSVLRASCHDDARQKNKTALTRCKKKGADGYQRNTNLTGRPPNGDDYGRTNSK